MPVTSSYGEYAAGEYLDYQKKYASTIRESDRVLISLVRSEMERAGRSGMSLVDVGCSSGNLLRHLKHQVPSLSLHGGDAFPGIIDACRSNPDLAGMSFEVMDILKLDPSLHFDMVTVNAVLFLFNQREFELAVSNLAGILDPGGSLFAFDLFDPYGQDLTVLEKSKSHPEGLTLHIRPHSNVRDTFLRNGFDEVSIIPFAIPIDLAAPADLDDISSRTVRTENGERLIFRGAFFTPWCHLTARKRR